MAFSAYLSFWYCSFRTFLTSENYRYQTHKRNIRNFTCSYRITSKYNSQNCKSVYGISTPPFDIAKNIPITFEQRLACIVLLAFYLLCCCNLLTIGLYYVMPPPLGDVGIMCWVHLSTHTAVHSPSPRFWKLSWKRLERKGLEINMIVIHPDYFGHDLSFFFGLLCTMYFVHRIN